MKVHLEILYIYLVQYLVSRDAITFKPVRRRACAPPTRGTGAGRAGRGGGAAVAPAGAESGGGPGSARRPQLTGGCPEIPWYPCYCCECRTGTEPCGLCPGESEETESCSDWQCPYWSEWAPW